MSDIAMMSKREMMVNCIGVRLPAYDRLETDYSESCIKLENLNIKVKGKLALKEKLLQDSEAIEHEKKVIQNNLDFLCTQIDSTNNKISCSLDVKQKLVYEKTTLEKERSDEQDDAKKKFSALRTAMAYFKKHLRCYIDIQCTEDLIFKFHFFKTEKVGDMDKFYVKLQCQGQTWKVLEIKPLLPCGTELSQHLASSGGIQAFLSHVREEFLKQLKQEE